MSKNNPIDDLLEAIKAPEHIKALAKDLKISIEDVERGLEGTKPDIKERAEIREFVGAKIGDIRREAAYLSLDKNAVMMDFLHTGLGILVMEMLVVPNESEETVRRVSRSLRDLIIATLVKQTNLLLDDPEIIKFAREVKKERHRD